MTTPTKRRIATALAAGLLIGLPAAALSLAPGPAVGASPAPGSQLAGINTSAMSAGTEVVLLVPGLVPVGDAAKGNVVDASLPYATSTAGTGPTTAGVSSPAYPGDVAANAGNSLQTFAASIPKAVVSLLNDPVAARSVYPEQLGVKSSSNFAPPGAGEAGVGTASSTSSAGKTVSKATVSNLNPLGAVHGAAALNKALAPVLKTVGGLLKGTPLSTSVSGSPSIEVGSASSATSATVNAASVSTTAHTHVGHITIAGIIKIDGISSTATAASNGKHGSRRSHLNIGRATVLGLPATIGPNGIKLQHKALGGAPNLVSAANKVLTALGKAGLTIRTIQPILTSKGSGATATSGALQVAYEDAHLPNLSALLAAAPVPLPNSVGIGVNIGYSQVTADATRLPPVKQVKTPPTPTPTQSTGNGGSPPVGGSNPGVVNPGGLNDGTTSTGGTPGPGTNPIVAQPAATATAFGIPIRVFWVVVSLLLALLAAGPLLAYANWQLLRGRSS